MISQTTSYAIFALACLDVPDGKYKLLRDVAKKIDVPAPSLSKIFNSLCRRGVVLAQRGVNGGVKLARKPDQICVMDICNKLDDKIATKTCILGLAECRDDAPCPGHEFWQKEREKIHELFHRTSLHDAHKALAKKGFKL